MSLQEAITILCKQLKEDPSYRIGWHANIAIAFKDQAQWDKRNWDKEEIHQTANAAADYFLNLLCRVYEANK